MAAAGGPRLGGTPPTVAVGRCAPMVGGPTTGHPDDAERTASCGATGLNAPRRATRHAARRRVLSGGPRGRRRRRRRPNRRPPCSLGRARCLAGGAERHDAAPAGGAQTSTHSGRAGAAGRGRAAERTGQASNVGDIGQPREGGDVAQARDAAEIDATAHVGATAVTRCRPLILATGARAGDRHAAAVRRRHPRRRRGRACDARPAAVGFRGPRRRPAAGRHGAADGGADRSAADGQPADRAARPRGACDSARPDQEGSRRRREAPEGTGATAGAAAHPTHGRRQAPDRLARAGRRNARRARRLQRPGVVPRRCRAG